MIHYHTPSLFFHRFNNVLELAYDNSIDYPMLWRYLADIITPVILQDQFTLTDLKPLIMEHLHPVGKAAALLAEILLLIKGTKVRTRLISGTFNGCRDPNEFFYYSQH